MATQTPQMKHHSAPTPFQYLKQHLDWVRFDCAPKYVAAYRQTLAAVLDRLDAYFLEFDLYQVVDYQQVVEELLTSPKFCFRISDTLFERKRSLGELNLRDQCIYIAQEAMGRDVFTQSILCHEFLHYLTVGQEQIHYTENDCQYVVNIGQQTLTKVHNGRREAITQGNAFMQGGFICEGFTALLEHDIYPEIDDPSYPYQCAMVDFLGRLAGGRQSLECFLRGNFTNFVQLLGDDNYQYFNNLCQTLHTDDVKYGKLSEKAKTSYYWAQDLVSQTVLQKVAANPEAYPSADYLQKLKTILINAPLRHDDFEFVARYQPELDAANQAMAHKKGIAVSQQNYYQQLLEASIHKMILAEKNEYQLPAVASNYRFAKQNNHLVCKFANCEFTLGSNLFQVHQGDCEAASYQYGTDNAKVWVQGGNNGSCLIRGEYQNRESQTINITLLPNRQGIVITNTADGKEIYQLDFQAEAHKQAALQTEVRQHTDLLAALEQGQILTQQPTTTLERER